MARFIRTHRLALFVALVAALELAVLGLRLGREATPFALVLIPTVVALGLTAAVDGVNGLRRLTGRVGLWRVGWRWYAAAVGIPLLAFGIVLVSGIALGQFSSERLAGNLTATAILIPLIVLLPAMLEEFGWRGFGVQAADSAGHSPAWAVAVVGGAHMLVHVPLYLPGHLYDELPIWPLPFMFLGFGVLLTWIYLRTGGSVLLAGLMHTALNAWVPLTWGLDPAWEWQARGIVFAATGLAVLSLGGWAWWRGRGSTHPRVESVPGQAFGAP
jgi:membrane protease YdiL (CAAX protease family)